MTSIPVLIEYDSDTKTYGATSPELPNVYAISDSRDDVLKRFSASVDQYLDYLRERGEPLPSFQGRHEIVTIAIPAI